VALGLELDDGGVDVAGGPEHDGVEDQAERAELVLHTVAVRLVESAPLAVAHVPGQLVAGLLHGELPVHLSAVGVVHRVAHPQQVLCLRDPSVLGEGRTQRGRAPVVAEHAQQVVGADLVGDQGTGDLQHVRPVRDHLVQVHRLRARSSTAP
jgi:hypothetical protein